MNRNLRNAGDMLLAVLLFLLVCFILVGVPQLFHYGWAYTMCGEDPVWAGRQGWVCPGAFGGGS